MKLQKLFKRSTVSTVPTPFTQANMSSTPLIQDKIDEKRRRCRQRKIRRRRRCRQALFATGITLAIGGSILTLGGFVPIGATITLAIVGGLSLGASDPRLSND